MIGSTNSTVGIILAGGRGERAKPITLESADYIRSKALVPFAGRRMIEWVIDACRRQGINRFYVVAHGQENRSQIKALLEHGERYGVDVRYSRSVLDQYNVGSGAATLHNLEQWDLTGQALVVPVDSVFDFSLEKLRAAQCEHDAVVTVAAVERTAQEVAGKYGVMRTDAAGMVNGFVEKPSMERIRAQFPAGWSDPAMTLATNAGMYLIDCRKLRRTARRPQLMRMAQQRLDFGRDLLPYLVDNDVPVAACAIDRLGDLGNVRDYLLTLADVLTGGYAQMNGLMEKPRNLRPRYWIHPTSLATRDDVTGTTLAHKIADGSVVIGAGVRIGRYVTIGPGVRLERADVGDGADLREGVRLSRSACGEAAIIGPYARISDSYIGPMAQVQSARSGPALLERYSAIGDGANLWPGTRLSGIGVYPRLDVPPLVGLPSGTQLTSSADIRRWFA